MGTAYNSRARDPPPRCFPGTRKGVFQEIEEAGREGKSTLWLHSPAGAGESVIAQNAHRYLYRIGQVRPKQLVTLTYPSATP